MPSDSSSSATARSRESSFLWIMLASSAMPRRSGMPPPNNRVFLMPPAMSTSATPCSLKILMSLPSCPTLIQKMASTRLRELGQGLAFMGHGDDLQPFLFCRPGEGEGKVPVPGYQTDLIRICISFY